MDNQQPDQYQQRYTEHQVRKAKVLAAIMAERHSSRRFDQRPIQPQVIDALTKAVSLCPSSCGRRAINLALVQDRDLKEILGGMLVGGIGWIHRAPAILLIFGDPVAYKAGDEIKFMPYLDAGVVIQQLYLAAAALGLSCVFANPNIRDHNIDHFKKLFGDQVFCGAFAFGYPFQEVETTADAQRRFDAKIAKQVDETLPKLQEFNDAVVNGDVERLENLARLAPGTPTL